MHKSILNSFGVEHLLKNSKNENELLNCAM